jgi:ABC-type uncharacterized transport system fused permease/ATPase subunit
VAAAASSAATSPAPASPIPPATGQLANTANDGTYGDDVLLHAGQNSAQRVVASLQVTNSLPQKPYIPIGTLRDAVKYPDEQSTASDAEIVAALEAVKLGHLTSRLDEVAHWTNILSGGEQQRVAAARALVFKPDWLFLDEATASLDEAMETAIYEALKQRLPTTTMVSIGHRPSLRKWHDPQVELRRAPGEVGQLVEAA